MLKREPLTGTDADYNTAQANFPNAYDDPFAVDLRITSSVDLDPILEKARQKRDSANKEESEVMTQSQSEPKKHTISKDPLNKDKGFEVSERNFVETKELLTSFKEKTAAFPKHLSYEGSMVVCVLLSMHREVYVPLSSLPQVDQQLIRNTLPDNLKDVSHINVAFDKDKDFSVSVYPEYHGGKRKPPFVFVLFNTVAHPRPEDLQEPTEQPVEEPDGTVSVKVGGGTLKFDKKKVASLAAIPQKQDTGWKSQEQEASQVLKTTNKNAYEIRADVLHMAIDWAKSRDDTRTDDGVLELAKKFYTFVENRR